MKLLLRLTAVILAFGIASSANAFVINYVLDVRTAGQWTLWANTDAPGGIASIVVDLGAGADAAATSVAPRSEFGGSPFAGFTLGNVFAAKQAFAGQNTSNTGSIKYGIGYQSIPNDTFAPAPFAMAPGSSAVLADLSFTGALASKNLNGFARFYLGTHSGMNWTNALKSPQPAVFGSVFAVAGNSTVTFAGSSLSATYTVIPDPEPPAVVLAAFAIPGLIFLVRRHRNSSKFCKLRIA